MSSTNKSIIASLKKLTILKGGNNATNYNTNEKDIQVDLVEIIYHSIVSINPTNHEFLDPNLYQVDHLDPEIHGLWD